MSFESAMKALDNFKPAGESQPAVAGSVAPPKTLGTAEQALDKALETGQAPASDPNSPALPGEAPKPAETASQAFQAITRAKKAQLEQSRKLKEREEAIALREKKLAEAEGRPTGKPADPIAALQAAGYSFSDASEFILNNSSLTPEQQIKAVREEIAALKQSQAEKETQAEESRKNQIETEKAEAVANFKGEIADYLATNAETFELCSQEDPGEVQELVYQLIAQALEQSVAEQKTTGIAPRILSVEEGMKLAEGYFEERAEKYAKTKKMLSRYAPKPTEDPAHDKQVPAAPGVRTLAQAPAAGSAGGHTPATSDDERFKRALAAADRAVAARRGQA